MRSILFVFLSLVLNLAKASETLDHYTKVLSACKNFSIQNLMTETARSGRAVFLEFEYLKASSDFSSSEQSEQVKLALNQCYGSNEAAKSQFLMAYKLADISGKLIGLTGHIALGRTLKIVDSALYTASISGLMAHLFLESFYKYLQFKNDPKKFLIQYPEIYQSYMLVCTDYISDCIDPLLVFNLNKSVLQQSEMIQIQRLIYANLLNEKIKLWQDFLRKPHLTQKQKKEALSQLEKLESLKSP